MKTIFYWSPFLTHVATISAVIESAKSLKKYSRKYDPVIIDACGEFECYKDILSENHIKTIDLTLFTSLLIIFLFKLINLEKFLLLVFFNLFKFDKGVKEFKL